MFEVGDWVIASEKGIAHNGWKGVIGRVEKINERLGAPYHTRIFFTNGTNDEYSLKNFITKPEGEPLDWLIQGIVTPRAYDKAMQYYSLHNINT